VIYTVLDFNHRDSRENLGFTTKESFDLSIVSPNKVIQPDAFSLDHLKFGSKLDQFFVP